MNNYSQSIQQKKIPAHLDVLNLIIKNSPKKLDMSLIHQKINSLKKQFNVTPFLDYSTTKKFYEYNVIYGHKSNNIIKTYSPKFFQCNTNTKSKINLKNNQDIQVFSEYEIVELFIQKCKDLGVQVKEELKNRFISFIKEKCVNRIIDLSDCSLGFNSMIILSDILNKNNDICSRVILTKNNFGDMGIELLIEKIKNNSNIVELNLSSNNIGVKGGMIIFNYLLNQNSIISLDLSSKEGIYRNRICAEGTKLLEDVLKTNFYLERIDLSSNSIKNEGLKYIVNGLISNISLQTLILSNNEINEKGIIYMESKINLCKLKHLDLSYNHIGNNGLILLGKCLSEQKLNEISYLNLTECSFNFDAFKPFIKQLSKNHKIQTLIFNKNNLYSTKWETLEDAFSGMSLKNMSLGSCGLGKIMRNVGHIFIRNASIRYLDFSHNQINDKEFEYFQDYPLTNLSLEEIDFSNNFITDKSASKFFKNLMYNNNIQKLNFYDNQLQNESAIAILEVVKKNHNIFSINVKCNRIGIKMIKEINMQITNNKMIEKGKYIPKLKDELRGLEFNPKEMDILRNKIINSNKEREILSKKFSEEVKEFSIKKKKKMEEVKNIENSFIQMQKEIINYEKKLKYINDENNNENIFFHQTIKKIKENINLVEKEIREIKIEQDIIKENQEGEISLLKDTYEKTLNNEQQMKVSISSLTKHLNNNKIKYQEKLDYLEKLKNAKLDIDTKQKENINGALTSRKLFRNNSKIIKDSFSNTFHKKKQKDINNNEDININNITKRRRRSQIVKIKLKKEE